MFRLLGGYRGLRLGRVRLRVGGGDVLRLLGLFVCLLGGLRLLEVMGWGLDLGLGVVRIVVLLLLKRGLMVLIGLLVLLMHVVVLCAVDSPLLHLRHIMRWRSSTVL